MEPRDAEAPDRVPLGPPPPTLGATRDAAHLLASHVLTPARYATTGKIGLRWTPGGIATPAFDGRRVVLTGSGLTVVDGATVRTETTTTLGAARAFVLGSPDPNLAWVEDLDIHDRPPSPEAATPVDIDPEAMAWLGDWFGLATAVLDTLRADSASIEATQPQLWPEHFDLAIEVLPTPRRASYGFSPGDAGHPDPYVYVSVWAPNATDTDGPLWNATGFRGAVLSAIDLVSQDDAVDTALGWLRQRRDALAS